MVADSAQRPPEDDTDDQAVGAEAPRTPAHKPKNVLEQLQHAAAKTRPSAKRRTSDSDPQAVKKKAFKPGGKGWLNAAEMKRQGGRGESIQHHQAWQSRQRFQQPTQWGDLQAWFMRDFEYLRVLAVVQDSLLMPHEAPGLALVRRDDSDQSSMCRLGWLYDERSEYWTTASEAIGVSNIRATDMYLVDTRKHHEQERTLRCGMRSVKTCSFVYEHSSAPSRDGSEDKVNQRAAFMIASKRELLDGFKHNYDSYCNWCHGLAVHDSSGPAAPRATAVSASLYSDFAASFNKKDREGACLCVDYATEVAFLNCACSKRSRQSPAQR